MKHIGIGSPEWDALRKEIVRDFPPGRTITHEWLEEKFELTDFLKGQPSDYENMNTVRRELEEFKLIKVELVTALRYQLLIDGN